MDALASYLACRDKAGRLRHLAQVKNQVQQSGSAPESALPISLAMDLLALDLSIDEKLAILEATSSRDGLALEHFLTEHLFDWSQDLASLAVRLWSQKTDNLLWFRVLQAVRSPLLPQRVLYTIIDNAHRAGGRRLIEAACQGEELEDMSTAYHGLLLHRAVQWGVENERLANLATATLAGFGGHLHPDNKALPSALAYFARFAPDEVEALLGATTISEPWRDIVRVMVAQAELWDNQGERLAKLVSKPQKSQTAKARLQAMWPPLWRRADLDAGVVAAALRLALEDTASGSPQQAVSSPWEQFAGIPEATLQTAVAALDDEVAFARGVSFLGGLLPTPAAPDFLETVKQRLAAATDPGTTLAALPLRLRLEMTEGAATGARRTPFTVVKAEEAAVLAGDKPRERATFHDYGEARDAARSGGRPPVEDPKDMAARKAFFDAAYRGLGAQEAAVAAAGNGFWGLLLDAWQKPSEAKLAALAQASRQVEGVFRLCYVNTLSRFKGMDQAALKLLDFIRSKEEDDLRAVVFALGGIGTPRAMQELVAAITRPNITQALQLEICGLLQKQDVSNLQNELRSAIKDLGPIDEGPRGDVREALAGLLSPGQVAERAQAGASTIPEVVASDAQLDQALTGKIQHYKELSSEVKRALRTSQFFHFQVSGANAPESIDLSPVIDMQYKALELLFRETFEEPCSRLIHRGILQRRLDVIGYARPIPRAMDEFEAYIASLPVIRDIPFFSKFKLRKMLRAICQFRPGKRFTLDGLKAFALFFLCFGRSECRYGLVSLFPLGFNDKELYDFCKALHILQDFRNRAAHEGFHPDASNDIDGIWRATAEIVQTMYRAKVFVESGGQGSGGGSNDYGNHGTPGNRGGGPQRPAPIIEKKKVS